MKNLFLLFFTILFLNSCVQSTCNRQTQTSILSEGYIIIDEIIQNNKYQGLVKYSIDNSAERSRINLSWFYDSIGKFNVGDTIRFIKK